MTFAALGGLIVVLGAAGWMYADSRAFNRTNAAGVEVFSGYFSMFFSRLFEGVLRLLGKLSFFLGLVAVAMGPNKQIRLTGSDVKLERTGVQTAQAMKEQKRPVRCGHRERQER
jgi:hypothetical protein